MNRSLPLKDTSPCALPFSHAEWRFFRICLGMMKEIYCTFLYADWISPFHLQWCGNIDNSMGTETQCGRPNPDVDSLTHNHGGTATSQKGTHCCFLDAFWLASVPQSNHNQLFYSGNRLWVRLSPCSLRVVIAKWSKLFGATNWTIFGDSRRRFLETFNVPFAEVIPAARTQLRISTR